MKKIALFLVLITSIMSCSLDNGPRETYSYNVLPIESHTLPETFKMGETYEIKLKYQKPTACHIFQGIYYAKDGNTRTIGIQVAVKNNQTCTNEVPEVSETSFKFTVTSAGPYIFKFYKGTDIEGKDLFDEVEVEVLE